MGPPRGGCGGDGGGNNHGGSKPCPGFLQLFRPGGRDGGGCFSASVDYGAARRRGELFVVVSAAAAAATAGGGVDRAVGDGRVGGVGAVGIRSGEVRKSGVVDRFGVQSFSIKAAVDIYFRISGSMLISGYWGRYTRPC